MAEKSIYSNTVNLPKTDFPMKAGLATRENEFLAIWEKLGVYEKIRQKNSGKKKYVLHDGPPYANGHIHLGTALNKILKDFVVKYKSASGFDAPYTPGWDCHGLPIEQQCLKEMGTDKHKVDLSKFRKEAAAFALKFVEIQKSEFKRLGVLADWKDPYLTLKHEYESVIIDVFGRLAQEGYIFRQKKPVYWCPTCETALADAEVEYAQHISHSIFVKFEVIKVPVDVSIALPASVLIWTTTPWTLPANVALAFHPDANYVLSSFTYPSGESENLIVAKQLIADVAKKINSTYKVLCEISGKKLEGIICKNPLVNRESVGILANFVTLDDGSGVVHIAPGHGQEDYMAGLKYKLPILSPVDHRGAFTDEVSDFAGHKVFAANPLIVEKLKSENKILLDYKFEHSYPHCWRCKRAVIFRATLQWFMGVDINNLRQKMLSEVKNVNWIPRYGENRIAGMLQTRPDWCLSRQRFWGVPIPVFYCNTCSNVVLNKKTVEKISKLFRDNGSDIWFDKTSKELSELLNIKCDKCGSNDLTKEKDILDVWFDSGVSFEAVLASGDYKDLHSPADMYLEGSDQHRGWFQTSLIPAVALTGSAPYKTVLTHGFVVDGEGKKMSKSQGNVILPQEVISKSGADILRLWVATSDYREDIRVSQEILNGISDSYRKIRNTFRFILGNLCDYKVENALAYEKLTALDQYAIGLLGNLCSEVNWAYENFEFHKVISAINRFCSVELSGFYLDALKDTLYCDNTNWHNRQSAQSAMYQILSALIRLCAPILSFTAEEAWQELRKIDKSLPESVFLADTFPKKSNYKELSADVLWIFNELFKLKETASVSIENLRKKKVIGSNLQTSVLITHPTPEKLNPELVSAVFGSFDVRIVLGSKQSVSVGKSVLEKCVRCWRHISDINEDGLCLRCQKALKERTNA